MARRHDRRIDPPGKSSPAILALGAVSHDSRALKPVTPPRTIIERQRELAELAKRARSAAQRAQRAPSIPDESDLWKDEITQRTSPEELAKLKAPEIASGLDITWGEGRRIRASGVAAVAVALAGAVLAAWKLFG
jgi:hypothetical protein